MFATKQGLLLLKKTQQYCATMSFTVPSGCYVLVIRHRLDLDYLDKDGNTHAVWPAGLHFPYPPWVGISFLITNKTTIFCIIVEDCRTKDSVTVNIDVVLTFRIMGDPNLGGDTNLVRKFVHELDMGRCQIHWRRRFASLYDGPAVIALACQMFDRKELIRENITEIATAVTVSSVRSLFGTAALVRSFGMKNPVLKLCMISLLRLLLLLRTFSGQILQ